MTRASMMVASMWLNFSHFSRCNKTIVVLDLTELECQTNLGFDVVHCLVGVHVVVGALDHGMLGVGLVLVIPELVLLPVMDDLGDVGYLGFEVDLRRGVLSG